MLLIIPTAISSFGRRFKSKHFGTHPNGQMGASLAAKLQWPRVDILRPRNPAIHPRQLFQSHRDHHLCVNTKQEAETKNWGDIPSKMVSIKLSAVGDKNINHINCKNNCGKHDFDCCLMVCVWYLVSQDKTGVKTDSGIDKLWPESTHDLTSKFGILLLQLLTTPKLEPKGLDSGSSAGTSPTHEEIYNSIVVAEHWQFSKPRKPQLKN